MSNTIKETRFITIKRNLSLEELISLVKKEENIHLIKTEDISLDEIGDEHKLVRLKIEIEWFE